VCININGENTSFFRTYKGLRQGNPLLPFSFCGGCAVRNVKFGQERGAC
jgi:hypothetical protein